MKKIILFYSLPLFIFQSLFAQVGIGTDTPDAKSVLHVDAPDNDKGILIPRITEEQRNSINPASEQNGLIIYNTTEGCLNYWNGTDLKWVSVCGKSGKAAFTVDCSQITVKGQYLNSVLLNSENKLIVTVNVTKPGTYRISAVSDSDNQYYFTLSDKFLTTGTYTLEIPGFGTPANFTPEGQAGDNFKIILNDNMDGSPCSFTIPVQNSSIKPDYRMDCASITVNGMYERDKPLDITNYIEVTIRFNAALQGAPLRIYTPKVDGIGFDSGSVTLNNGGISSGMVTQVVKLQGFGIPDNFDPKTMTLLSNSTASSATCTALISVNNP